MCPAARTSVFVCSEPGLDPRLRHGRHPAYSFVIPVEPGRAEPSRAEPQLPGGTLRVIVWTTDFEVTRDIRSEQPSGDSRPKTVFAVRRYCLEGSVDFMIRDDGHVGAIYIYYPSLTNQSARQPLFRLSRHPAAPFSCTVRAVCLLKAAVHWLRVGPIIAEFDMACYRYGCALTTGGSRGQPGHAPPPQSPGSLHVFYHVFWPPKKNSKKLFFPKVNLAQSQKIVG